MQHSGSFDPTSLANPEWLTSGNFDSFYVEAYELAMAPEVVPRKIFRFTEIVVAIKTAKLEYLEIAGIKVKFGKNRQMQMAADHRTSTSDFSPKVITIQPHCSQLPDTINELADRSAEFVSLLISTNYRNIAFRKLFTHVAGLGNNSMMAAGSLMRLPFDMPAPDLAPNVLDRFPRCHNEIETRAPEKKQKIRLSLHWHLKGIESDGLDSFLSLWIALETLTMNSTNIADLNNALAATYKITPSTAAVEFGAGRIFGLRSEVVHNGIRKRISTNLTEYMECLYADLLMHELLGVSLGRARGFLISKGLKVEHLTS